MKAQEELQKSIQTGKDLDEKLRNIQKDFDCHRHNAESVKAALEKKIKDQVCQPFQNVVLALARCLRFSTLILQSTVISFGLQNFSLVFLIMKKSSC